MNEVKAKLSRLPVSGFKVRLLADQIRGKYVSEALDILNFSKKSSSKNLKKLKTIKKIPIKSIIRSSKDWLKFIIIDVRLM